MNIAHQIPEEKEGWGEGTLQRSNLEHLLQPWSVGKGEKDRKRKDIHLQRPISIKIKTLNQQDTGGYCFPG